MIGAVRFVLASLVAANHTFLPTANLVGAHAVTAFYMISGYLMTKVIHEVYGLTLHGTGRFLMNRFLRIYPPYLFFVAVSLILLALFPTTFGQTYSNMQMPGSGYDFFRNITLFDLPHATALVIPPAWTLTVEVFFYLAMALLLSRHRAIVICWFAVSLAITIWLLASGATFGERYSPLHAASMFFSTGALVYFHQDLFARLAFSRRTAWAALTLFCVAPLLTRWAGLTHGIVGFYGPAILFVPIFMTVLRSRSGSWDRWLGDLAYPVFITHLLAAGIIRILFPQAVTPLSFWFFVFSYLLCVGISALFIRASAKWLDPVRTKVRAIRPQGIEGDLGVSVAKSA